MHIRSVASWLLLSYFTPFIAFFFGIFWFGLNVWIFLVGMLVVSFLTLSLFLKIKDWEQDMFRHLQAMEQAQQNRPKIVAKPLSTTSTIASIHNLLKNEPSHVLDLILRDEKNSLKMLEHDHERIVSAYEDERLKLFDEISYSKQEIENLKATLLANNEQTHNQAEEIKNLKCEIEILLGMDQELLRTAVQ